MWLESDYTDYRFLIQSPSVGAKALVLCRDEGDWFEGEVIAVKKNGHPLDCDGDYSCEFILDRGSFAVGIDIGKKVETPQDLKVAEYC